MTATARRSPAQRTGLWLGIATFIAMLSVPAPGELSPEGWRAAALAVLMAIWWATEALPIAATSMLPLAAGPLLGLSSVEEAGQAYGSSTIFLIMGGCLLALALERWQLHRRIAYSIVARGGQSGRSLIWGVMLATAFVSMWVSNTSTTLMMLPVATAVAGLVTAAGPAGDPQRQRFQVALVLGVPYAATIGGLGTIIGTPTNALAVAFMEQNYGVRVSFAGWMAYGMPIVALLLPLAWWVLTRITHRCHLPDVAAARALVTEQLAGLGRMTTAERRVAWIGLAAAAAWIGSPWLRELPGLGRLSDMGVAMLTGLALYLVPAGDGQGSSLLDGKDFRRLPWDTLFLFGGGLALAALIQDSGLSAWLGQLLGTLSGWPILALTVVVVLLIVFWTELSSNVATAATFMPVLAAMAAATGQPVLQLVAPAALAASCGFMLPVGTAPNAIAYGSGLITLRDMMRAGLWLDILSALVVVGVGSFTLRWLL